MCGKLVPDRDATRETIETKEDTMTNYTLDPDAALAEGLAPMPADLVSLRNESLSLSAEIDRLTARRDEIKASFSKRLEEDGLKGYILDGKVHARITQGNRSTIDSKQLRDAMPHIYAQYLRITPYTSIKIN